MSMLRTTSLVLLPLLLAACATPSPRPTPPPAAAASAPSAMPPLPPVAAPPPIAAPDLWARLRTGFTMPGCDADPAIADWARRYAAGGRRFEAMATEYRPLIALAQSEMTALGVPDEFALLPWVESNYRADARSREGPAGMWQFMASTARGAGLVIEPGYDGRLDPIASTRAAARLLAGYGRDLGDWRLVDWAFNQGEYRIRGMLAQRGAPPAEPALPDWPVGAISRSHLTQLLGLACIVSDPHRFNVDLPAVDPRSALVVVELPQPIDLDLAARLAGLAPGTLRALNPGYRRARMPGNAPHHLLLPRPAQERFAARYERLPAASWAALQPYRLQRPARLGDLLPAGDPQIKMLARANAVDADVLLATQRVLWLPGDLKPTSELARVHIARRVEPLHRVRSGETLWTIARTQRIPVRDLERWNHLHGSILLPGQWLRLTAPD
ncbi:MAG: transglycosylase SLT domain-containing protein [Xanthomonadaceae bacterium]|nr:transglycosylase SLT domain-containing protein [Xanthomonadaceae bacterium]MDE2244821.1 transglycosylase SLT domain-containing protein [Xanthomonadaceae bacterium]